MAFSIRRASRIEVASDRYLLVENFESRQGQCSIFYACMCSNIGLWELPRRRQMANGMLYVWRWICVCHVPRPSGAISSLILEIIIQLSDFPEFIRDLIAIFIWSLLFAISSLTRTSFKNFRCFKAKWHDIASYHACLCLHRRRGKISHLLQNLQITSKAFHLDIWAEKTALGCLED